MSAAPQPAVLVLPYDPAWPLRAAGLTAGLRAALGPAAVRVEHIGSTVVPGTAGPDCTLHVRLLGSPHERLVLLFRDWFRARPEAVPGYAAFKRTLAGAVADLDAYAAVKDPVVDLVVALAEPWAAATGCIA